jgi:hypothetical protein
MKPSVVGQPSLRRSVALRVGMLATAALSVAALSVGSATAQNVAQAELAPGGAVCPRNGQTEIIPGLKLTLETSGRPVLVSYVIGFASGPQGNLHLIPVINNIFDVPRQLDRAIGDFLASGQRDVVSFSYVYALAAGTHTFALCYSDCQSQIEVIRGWLTVYELPKH